MKTIVEINSFLEKKRVPKHETMEWVRWIAESCIKIIDKSGKFGDMGNTKSKVKSFTNPRIRITYTTPFNKLPGAEDKYNINIWDLIKNQKVFNCYWEPLEIASFKKGEWIKELIT